MKQRSTSRPPLKLKLIDLIARGGIGSRSTQVSNGITGPNSLISISNELFKVVASVSITSIVS